MNKKRMYMTTGELARIMGGIEITENTKKLAEEMLNNNWGNYEN